MLGCKPQTFSEKYKMTRDAKLIFEPRLGYDAPDIELKRFGKPLNYDDVVGLNLVGLSILEIVVCGNSLNIKDIGGDKYRVNVCGEINLEFPKTTNGVVALARIYDYVNAALSQ